MADHALLSASAASRWMNCTASPRFEAQFPETTSEYAEEGRLAHSLCELKARKMFITAHGQSQYAAKLDALRKEPRYSIEMDRASDLYVEHLAEKAMMYAFAPFVDVEVRVDLSAYVPEGFGTCDCVMIGGDTLNITDFKYGKGVPVSAENNPQTRLYALGALAKYAPFYGGIIRRVCLTIDQPRVRDAPDSETLTVDELLAWGETVKPAAVLAYSGFGEFKPGDYCRFCRGKAVCRARADAHTALEDFKDLSPPGSVLSAAEIGDLLKRGKNLVAWFNDLEDYALKSALRGDEIPGWKAATANRCPVIRRPFRISRRSETRSRRRLSP